MAVKSGLRRTIFIHAGVQLALAICERKDHITKAEKGLLRYAARNFRSGHIAVGIDPVGLSSETTKMGMYLSPNEGLITFSMHKRLGIKNMQVACDIQIINCTYGYSRKVADPKNSSNKNCRLKLNAYDRTREGTENLVYGAKLDTEGILFEVSQRRIIEWLYANRIISEEQLPDLDDEISVKNGLLNMYTVMLFLCSVKLMTVKS